MAGTSFFRDPRVGYVAAAALTAGAVALSYLAPPLAQASPFTLFFLAAVVASRWGGIGPGLFVTVAGGLAAQFLFAPPYHLPGTADTLSAFRLYGFVVMSAVACWATASLREAGDRITRVLDSISEGFTVVDRRWRLIHVNRVAADFAGRPAADLIGKDLFEAHPLARMPSLEQELRRAMREQQPGGIEAQVPGSERWIEARIVPSSDGLSAFTRDVTDAKLMHRQLAATMAALARSNQVLDDFASTVSHELVQPLGSIVTFAHMIREESEGASERHAGRILEVSTRMSSMLREHLGRARAVGQSETHELTSLDTLLADLSKELSGTLGDTRIDGRGLPAIQADPVLVRQLLHSLIMSALRLGAPASLRFTVEHDDLLTRVAMDLIPRSGEAAREAPSPARLDADDDLAIATQLVRLHGGQLSTRFEPGQPARIDFTLPAAIVRRSEAAT